MTKWLGGVARMMRAWIWLLIVQIHLDIWFGYPQSQSGETGSGQPAYQTISLNTV